MSRRFWIAYTGCALGIAAVFALAWWMNPTTSAATGDAAGDRSFITVTVVLIPTALAALRARKLTDPTGAAQWGLPVALAIGIAIAALALGLLPDDPGTCAYLGRFDEVDESCATSARLRWRVLIEALAMWGLFGFLTFVFSRRRD